MIDLPKDEKRKVGPVYRVFSQDLHSTQLHGEAIGFRQAEVWRSKSRQFSKDAAIIGNVETTKRSDDKEKLPRFEKAGFIILRQSLWKEVDKLDRRLVVKLFSSSGGWIATMEEMVAEEYAASFVSGEPLVTFTVLSKESEMITWVRQQKRGKLSTENYSFYILGPDKTFEAFRIEGARGSMGDDYDVVRLNGGQKVAQIDSKFGDLGGEFKVNVKDPVLAENEWFCRVLQCFSIMVAYRTDIKDKINKGINLWKKGKKIPKQHRYEISLLANPRKLTLNLQELEEV